MSDLKVINTTFAYPDPSQSPGWGEGATDWAIAITDAVNTLAGPGFINETQSTIENNTTKPINGLIFNQALTQGIDVTYRIFRKTDSIEFSEKGNLSIVYKPSTTEKWFMTRDMGPGDDSLVNLDIDANGQVNYVSTPISGTNYQGFIRFKTISILK